MIGLIYDYKVTANGGINLKRSGLRKKAGSRPAFYAYINNSRKLRDTGVCLRRGGPFVAAPALTSFS